LGSVVSIGKKAYIVSLVDDPKSYQEYARHLGLLAMWPNRKVLRKLGEAGR
jgi:hypothetical protein